MKQMFIKSIIISLFCLATAACSSNEGNTHEAETEAAEAAETPAAENAAEDEMETIDSVQNQ